jgi:hypothetical protein
MLYAVTQHYMRIQHLCAPGNTNYTSIGPRNMIWRHEFCWIDVTLVLEWKNLTHVKVLIS